ncbi:hypothetical protein LDO51_16935 [Providencia alcalifaciens]|uniref:hypothetical protein n=1 Tax=Providencia alcalifaciens TaxID=126385 RepID=UPI001CE05E18|nr:hypothetical protein [Providencia alcalifaciens]UBX48807.1 hypothetical protein LDO51_16935 [Providencia alcalifaciens]
MKVVSNCLILSKKDSDDKLLYQYGEGGFIKSTWIARLKNQVNFIMIRTEAYTLYYNDNKLFLKTVVEYNSGPAKPHEFF